MTLARFSSCLVIIGALLCLPPSVRADCPANALDLSPGQLDMSTDPPTWRVTGGDGVDVGDVIVALRAAVGIQQIAWVPPISENCPENPGDASPGELDEGTNPPTWTPLNGGAGRIDVSDVIISLRLSVGALQLPPGSGAVASANTDLRQLTGSVVGSGALGALAGVDVELRQGEQVLMTVTDDNGDFLFWDAPPGEAVITVMGGAIAGKFTDLEVEVELAAASLNSLPPLVLPDLEDPDAAAGEVDVEEGGVLMTQAKLSAADRDDVELTLAAGTEVTVGDQPASGKLTVAVIPVEEQELATELPPGEELNATSTASVQPANGKFTAAGQGGAVLSNGSPTGVDITLPNDKMLPIGTMVDIWGFDSDDGLWVNRSAETGNQGEVLDISEEGEPEQTAVVAVGVVTEGGWHAAVVPLVAECATSLAGVVVDDFGQVLSGVYVSTSVSPRRRTTPDGYELTGVAAYTGLEALDCEALEITVTATAPFELGGNSVSVVVPAESIVMGGVTPVPDLVLSIPNDGCVSGRLRDAGMPLVGVIDVVGPAGGFALPTDGSGAFFQTGVPAGTYFATYQFPNELAPRTFSFDVETGRCLTLLIERLEGAGDSNLDVVVLLDGDGRMETPNHRAAGVIVELRGTDASSAGGLRGRTNQDGRVSFLKVDGPYTVTAAKDVVTSDGRLVRLVASLLEQPAPQSTLSLVLTAPHHHQPYYGGEEGMVSGTVTGGPGEEQFEFLRVDLRERGSEVVHQVFPDAFGAWGPVYVTADKLLDPTVIHFGGDPPRPLAAQLLPSVRPLSGTTVVADSNLAGPTTFPFDQPMAIDWEGLEEESATGLALTGRRPDGRGLHLDVLATDGGLPPALVWLPDFEDPALADFELFLSGLQVPFYEGLGEIVEGQGEPGGRGSKTLEKMQVPNRASRTVNFAATPTIVDPAPESLLGLADVQALAVDVFAADGGPGAEGEGYDHVLIHRAGDGCNLAVGAASWSVYLPPGGAEFTLPPSPLPFFATGQVLEVGMRQFRSSVPLVFEDFFGPDLARKSAELFVPGKQTATSDTSVFVYVDGPCCEPGKAIDETGDGIPDSCLIE